MSFTRQQIQQIEAANRIFQARADDALASYDVRAPLPLSNEAPGHYRRRVLNEVIQRLSENNKYSKIDAFNLADDALPPYENLIYPESKIDAFRNDRVPIDQPMQRRIKVDENGQKWVHWVHPECFIKQMNIAGRLARFWNDRYKEWVPKTPYEDRIRRR